MSVLRKVIRYLALFLVLYSLMAWFESIKIEMMLQDFKENANVIVYDLDDEIDFTFSQNDILLSRKSGHSNLLFRDIISFYVGGHAGLVIDESGEKTIEVYGYDGLDNTVHIEENDWINTAIEVIGLRTVEVELDYTLFIGQNYDWIPFFPNNNKYCTELITATYKNTGLQLDYDRGIVTVNDMVLSKDVELFLYKEIKDNKIFIYWED